jgi:hypothetical protein
VNYSCIHKDVNTHWDLTVALKVKALKKLRAFLFYTDDNFPLEKLYLHYKDDEMSLKTSFSSSLLKINTLVKHFSQTNLF